MGDGEWVMGGVKDCLPGRCCAFELMIVCPSDPPLRAALEAQSMSSCHRSLHSGVPTPLSPVGAASQSYQLCRTASRLLRPSDCFAGFIKHPCSRCSPVADLLRQPSALPYRSHSPKTMSTEPRMATISPTIWPGISFGRMLRFTKDGARIFRRWGTPPPLLLI